MAYREKNEDCGDRNWREEEYMWGTVRRCWDNKNCRGSSNPKVDHSSVSDSVNSAANSSAIPGPSTMTSRWWWRWCIARRRFYAPTSPTPPPQPPQSHIVSFSSKNQIRLPKFFFTCLVFYFSAYIWYICIVFLHFRNLSTKKKN